MGQDRETGMNMSEVLGNLSGSLERIAAAAALLEGSAARLEHFRGTQAGEVEKLTAAVEAVQLNAAGLESGVSLREAELERKLVLAEQAIATLRAAGAASAAHEESRVSARKTLPAATVQLLAKQGIDMLDTVDVQSLDTALAGLSVEQRIAIKSQMMRNGTLTA